MWGLTSVFGRAEGTTGGVGKGLAWNLINRNGARPGRGGYVLGTQEASVDDIQQQHEGRVEEDEAAQTRRGPEGWGHPGPCPPHSLQGGPQPLGGALEEI